jgi:hypothetical protein
MNGTNAQHGLTEPAGVTFTSRNGFTQKQSVLLSFIVFFEASRVIAEIFPSKREITVLRRCFLEKDTHSVDMPDIRHKPPSERKSRTANLHAGTPP